MLETPERKARRAIDANLRAWKQEPRESFSRVVLKVVPKRGTLADLAEEMEKLPKLDAHQARVLESEVEWANDWRNQRDAWSS